MPKYNKQNIDRKTNKPALKRTEGLTPDVLLNRAMQIRRDDDVIRSAKRTAYDIDYAIKWYIENEIQPQITADKQLIPVPVIFANGEKWDNVRRLGYLRDEKGMLQSPLIMIKRTSVAERDSQKTLDVNRHYSGNQLIYKQRYNKRNQYQDQLFPPPLTTDAGSQEIFVIDIPKYVSIEYEIMLWCDFSTQMNDLIDQGKSIVMISSELPEILRMSHRIVVMCEGRITGEILNKNADQESIMALATMRA